MIIINHFLHKIKMLNLRELFIQVIQVNMNLIKNNILMNMETVNIEYNLKR